jgi:UDP-2,3-diacylglucosamine pyrophosphatase LpxH
MIVAVISDLHIGIPETGSNDYKINDSKTIEALDYLYSKADTIILNGDIVECWEAVGISLDTQEYQFEKIKASHQVLFEYITNKINAKKMIYVVGNHDDVIFRRNLFPDVQKFYVIDKKILVAHGHQVDFANADNSFLGKCVTCCIGHAEKIIFKDIDVVLGDIYDTFARHENEIYEKCAAEHFLNGAIGVIFGHTHKAYVISIGNGWYANSGCWRDKESGMDVIFADTSPGADLLSYKKINLSEGGFSLENSSDMK